MLYRWPGATSGDLELRRTAVATLVLCKILLIRSLSLDALKRQRSYVFRTTFMRKAATGDTLRTICCINIINYATSVLPVAGGTLPSDLALAEYGRNAWVPGRPYSREPVVAASRAPHLGGRGWIISNDRVTLWLLRAAAAAAASTASASVLALEWLECVVANDRWLSENSLAADVCYKRIWTLLNL